VGTITPTLVFFSTEDEDESDKIILDIFETSLLFFFISLGESNSWTDELLGFSQDDDEESESSLGLRLRL
jgi:hypothetical protein